MPAIKKQIPVTYTYDMIPLGKLFVDSYADEDALGFLPEDSRLSYQRKTTSLAARIVGDGLKPDLFGTLIVNRRGSGRNNGRYAVVDGGTRYRALTQMPTIGEETLVPCLVHKWDKDDEIRNYLEWNQERMGLTPVDKFIGRLRMGDAAAAHMNELLLLETGMGVYPGHWACVHALTTAYDYDEGKTLRSTLEIMRRLNWHTKPRGRTQYIVGGVSLLVRDGIEDARAYKQWAALEPTDVVEGGKQFMKKLDLVLPEGGSRQVLKAVGLFLLDKYNMNLPKASKVRATFV